MYDEDPFRRDQIYDSNERGGGSAWGWAAGAVLVVLVVGLLFAIGHQPGQIPGTNTAMNDSNPPVTRMAPPVQTPSNVSPTTTTPAPGRPAAPIAPTPAAPAQP